MGIGVGEKSLMDISSPFINQSYLIYIYIYGYGWRMHEWMMDDESMINEREMDGLKMDIN